MLNLPCFAFMKICIHIKVMARIFHCNVNIPAMAIAGNEAHTYTTEK
jgi:hypothetical protein